MNKTLKFAPDLVPLVLSGKKTTTWRVFDDKNLSEHDILDLLDGKTKEKFGTAKIVQVTLKKFADLKDEDMYGHEQFANLDEMYAAFSKMYKTQIVPETMVKIIKFELQK